MSTISLTSHTVTTDQLRDQIVATIANAVGSVVQGTANDITNYATAIANDLALAQTEIDPAKRAAIINELQAQVVMLAEINRIRASETAYETVRSVIATASGVLSGVLAAFGQGLGAAAAGAVSHALGGPKNPSP